MKPIALIAAGISATLLSACGGGSDAPTGAAAPSAPTSSPATPAPPPAAPPASATPGDVNVGGSPASPAALSFDRPNQISADSFANNFKVTVRAGDTLVLRSTLKATLSDVWFSRCSSNATAYYTGLTIAGQSQSCSLDLKHKFPEAGEFLIRVGYPEGNSGQLDAALLSAGQSPAPVATASGRPDQPRAFDLAALNPVASNAFFNHYAIDAKAGETLYIQVYPVVAPTPTDAARCASGSLYANYYSYGVVMDEQPSFVCGTYFEHKFASDGRYRFALRFKTEGQFRAVILPTS